MPPVKGRPRSVYLFAGLFALQSVAVPISAIGRAYYALQGPYPVQIDSLTAAAIIGLASGALCAASAVAVYQLWRVSLLLIPALLVLGVVGFVATLIAPESSPGNLIGVGLVVAINLWAWTTFLRLEQEGLLQGRSWSARGLAFWSHTYNREQLLVASRWLLVLIGCIHEGIGFGQNLVAETTDASEDGVGMMIAGFLYVFVAVLPSLWLRTIALTGWVLDIAYSG